MQFVVVTVYDQKAVSAMARALRKTLRKKQSRRSHVLGWLIVALSVLVLIPWDGEPFQLDVRSVVTMLAGALVLLILLFEDSVNGYIARKRMMVGTSEITTVFESDQFVSSSEVGESRWKYDKIQEVVELSNYFVFLFDRQHAQVYDKRAVSGGSVEEFRSFLESRTEKPIRQLKK